MAGRKPADQQMFARLREIRAAAQYLQNFATQARTQVASLDPAARAGALLEALSPAFLNRLEQTIAPVLDSIRQAFAADSEEYEWCADSVATIRLTWASIKDLWPAATLTYEAADQRLTAINALLDQIVYQCASLTIAPRVNDCLANLRTGQVLDFDFEFGNELPQSTELRKRLILELVQESGVIAGGIVDADNRVIYKIAPTRGKQVMSLVRLLLWFVAGGAAIPLVITQITHFTWPLYYNLLQDYVFLFAGTLAHLAIEAIKAARAQTRPSFQAMNDWVLWVHVREMQLLWGIFDGWLGYVLLVTTLGAASFQWQAAFFSGYSIDSVVEVFLGRFQAVVKAQTAAITA